MNYYYKADDIVGYDYNAARYCNGGCVLKAMPFGEGGKFDGWKDLSTPPMPTEANLTDLALHFGIDRDDESTFDQSEFPKVIFASDAHSDDWCSGCGCHLLYLPDES